MHLEAQAVLVRAVRSATEYEKQLQQIQLNEQNKLLDAARAEARGRAAEPRQLRAGHERAGRAARSRTGSSARPSSSAPTRSACSTSSDATPGAARAKLAALPPAELGAKRASAAKLFGLDPDVGRPTRT